MLSFLMYAGGLALVVAFLLSRTRAKSITIAILLMFYIGDIWINDSFVGVWASEGMRYYLFNSFHELLLVFFLHLKPCKETAIIMLLSLFSVVVHMLGFTLYISGEAGDIVINYLSMMIFYIMLLILISKKAADRVYRCINRVSIVRSYCTDNLKIRDNGTA